MALLENRLKKYHTHNRNTLSFARVENISRYGIRGYFMIITALVFLFCSYAPKSLLVDIEGAMYKYTITPSRLLAQNSLKYIVNLMNFERLQSQNALLKIENHKLRNIILENSIIATNEKRIIDSLNVSSFINDFGTKARVIFSSINENKNYAIITGGKSANIKVGDIMLSNKALAGRVIATGENYTKVLLVTSANSRVPVISASKDMRAIIAGDADLGAVLIYPQGSELCKKNDILYTSGEGLMYPRGIAVATMHKDVSRGCIPKLLMDIDNLDVVEIIDSSQFFVE